MVLDVSITIDQTEIISWEEWAGNTHYGSLTVNSGRTLTINDGTGDDLLVEDLCYIINQERMMRKWETSSCQFLYRYFIFPVLSFFENIFQQNKIS